MTKLILSFSSRLFNESEVASLIQCSNDEKLNEAIRLAYYNGLKIKDIIKVVPVIRRTLQYRLSSLSNKVFSINISYEQLRQSCIIRLLGEGKSPSYVADYMNYSRRDKQPHYIKTSGWMSPKLRFEVFVRDSFKCVYCNRIDVPIEVDHIIPISKGGKTISKNLQTTCERCNYGKSDNIL